MKKLLILLPICFILQACPDMGDSIDYDYTIVNNSGKTITMIPYVNGVIDTQNVINLPQGGKLNKKYTYKPPGAAGYSMSQFFIANSDYVAFSFNNEKINIFSVYSGQCTTCPNIPNSSFPIIYNENTRNLFNQSFNDEQVETYTITAEDYQNASNCGGNCY